MYLCIPPHLIIQIIVLVVLNLVIFVFNEIILQKEVSLSSFGLTNKHTF